MRPRAHAPVRPLRRTFFDEAVSREKEAAKRRRRARDAFKDMLKASRGIYPDTDWAAFEPAFKHQPEFKQARGRAGAAQERPQGGCSACHAGACAHAHVVVCPRSPAVLCPSLGRQRPRTRIGPHGRLPLPP